MKKNKLFTWIMILLIVIGAVITVWGFIAGFGSANYLPVDALLTFAYICVILAIAAVVLVGLGVSIANDKKNLVKIGIAILAIAAICFIVYLIAPGTPAQGLTVDQPSAGTLKLTDTVLYLAYFLAILAVIAIVVGEIRMALNNKKG